MTHKVTCSELFTKFDQVGGNISCGKESCSYNYLNMVFMCDRNEDSREYIKSKLAYYEKLQKAIPKVTYHTDKIAESWGTRIVTSGFSVTKEV